VIHRAGEPIDYVYFPTSCLVSMVAAVEKGSTVEAATAGSDGFVGVSALLGMERADITAVVQMDGETLRMRIGDFRRHLADERFRQKLGAFVAKTVATIAQTAACNAFHPVQERLARWLMLVRDSTEREEFPLTQEFIAVLLGVHRPTVSIAIRRLESAGLIEHSRGLIHIVDSPALAKAACECYRLSGWERSRR
jgi:CRP-like cAMP-binding protein